jgi:uncharacterized protein (TIGR03437 family)
MVGGIFAPVIFVSPGQVNFIVPAELRGGRDVNLRIELWGRYGPTVAIHLKETAPALFHSDPDFAVASRVDGTIVSAASLARAGDVLSLYATGLGLTDPEVPPGSLARQAAPIKRLSDFRAQACGIELPREAILYAGTAPGFAGLYQINLVLPDRCSRNPDIRIGLSEVWSPEGVRLPVD